MTIASGPIIVLDCGCRHWVESGELVIDCSDCDYHEPAPRKEASPASLAEIHDPDAGTNYPTDVLAGHTTALCLFCAAWFGRQDAYWLADAGLVTTCVDTDAARLEQMQAVYPSGWTYFDWDAFTFAELAAVRGSLWDVVSLDPFTNLIPQCVDMVPLWCKLARHVVILGTLHDTPVWAPWGWRHTEQRHRSDNYGGVFWTVLER